MGDILRQFANDERALALWTLLVVGFANFIIAIWRSRPVDWGGDGTFDVHRLPKFLDSLVFRQALPLLVLGVTAMLTSPEISAALWGIYGTGVAAAIAAQVADLRSNWEGMPLLPIEEPKG
jgi:hypothetical protein